MNRRFGFLLVGIACVVLFPFRAPAPLFYVPGEGWYYEPYGQNIKWQRARAKEQLDVAQQAFASNDHDTALHAAHRILRLWPRQTTRRTRNILLAAAWKRRNGMKRLLKPTKTLIEKYPRSNHYTEVLWRQYGIANRFLGGEWFRVCWGLIPLYPSMEQTAQLFDKIVNNGPYSEVAPHAQLRIGAAREKQKSYPDAVKAYATAADRYHNQPTIASDALFREGVSYAKQAATAEYDQNTAAQAIASFTDFITLFPDDQRVPRGAKGHCRAQGRTSARQFSNCAILRKEQNLERLATGGARWFITTKCCSWIRIRLTPQPRANVLKRSNWAPPCFNPQLRNAPAGTFCPWWRRRACSPAWLAHHGDLGPVNGAVAGERSIEVLPFNNQTLQPRLGDAVTQALRERLQTDGTYHLATHSSSESVVSGVIMRYNREGWAL